MRKWQARFAGPAMMIAAASVGASLGMAQPAGQNGGGNASTATKGSNPPLRTSPTPASTSTPQNRAIWVSGRVTMYDGSEPPESLTIERACSANSVHAEGYTDSKGHFSFNVGQSNGAFADASTNSLDQLSQQLGLATVVSNTGGAGGNGNLRSDSENLDCELRARLAGYRSSTVPLAGRRALDSPDVGVIVLYPQSKIQGLTASATAIQAPRGARKAYEKGLAAVAKDKPDQAELEFREAVQIYPKYAAAWLELGKALERSEHYPEAREAYGSSLAADPKYVYPYEQLYQLAWREKNWRDLATQTDQLLRLNPYEFPAAYYFNALAHLQLKEYEAAQASAEQAVEADRKQVNPKTHYLLGAILIQRRNWAAAAASLREYLKAAPNASDKALVEKTLGQLDQQSRRVQAISPDFAAQQ